MESGPPSSTRVIVCLTTNHISTISLLSSQDHTSNMSVLVDRKKPTAPYYGKSPQNSASVRNAATLKGERQKENQSKVSSGPATAVAEGGRTGAMTGVEKMNMIAIQRVDSHVRDLLSTVPQVVLYQYEAEGNIWVRNEGWGVRGAYRGWEL